MVAEVKGIMLGSPEGDTKTEKKKKSLVVAVKTKLCLGDSLLTCLTEGKSVYEVAKARSRA